MSNREIRQRNIRHVRVAVVLTVLSVDSELFGDLVEI